MLVFLLNRLWQSVILLLIVSIIGFTILNLMPGGPLAQFALDPGMTQADMDRLAEQMGLNRPLPVQYFDWLMRMLRGDWGTSFRDGVPVLDVIGRHLFATLLLMGSFKKLASAPWDQVAIVTVTAMIGIAALAAGVQGWLLKRTNGIERWLLIAAGLALVYPKPMFDYAGVAMVVLAIILQKMRAGAPHAAASS